MEGPYRYNIYVKIRRQEEFKLADEDEQRRITEKAPSGTAGGGFLVVGYKSDLRLDRGVAKTRSEGHMNRRC